MGTGQWLFLFLGARPSCPPSGCPPRPVLPQQELTKWLLTEPCGHSATGLNAECAGGSNLDDPGNQAEPCSVAA